MTSKTTRRFRDAFRDLPEPIQRQARAAYRLFQADPSHPSLNFKPVAKVPPTYSVRVGLHHRAGAVRGGDESRLVLDRLACGVRQLLKRR